MITQEKVRAPGKRKAPATKKQLKVAYIVSRFPKLTETFVVDEIMAMREEVETVEIFPLLRERADVVHADAAQLVHEAHYTPLLSAPLLRATAAALLRQPGVCLSALRTVLWETWGNRRFFLAGIALFPKAMYLAQEFKARKVDWIHAHFATHPAAVAFMIHRLTGIPYSFTAHGSDLHRRQEMLCKKIEEAAFAVTISEYNRRFIGDHCGAALAGKVHVVHCGIDLQRFQARPPRRRTGREPFRLLCIGTLHEVKGQRYLLEAVGALQRAGIGVACDLVGDGPDRAVLERQATDLQIADCVTFWGRRTREEVLSHLRQADALVAPSVPSSDGRREGIPVVLMEAMASGVPVIASRLSGIPELVHDEACGLLAPPGDAQGLEQAIRRLYGDPSLAGRLGHAGRQRVEEAFDLRRNVATLAQLIAEGKR